jgi:hypothetical protein
VVIVTGMRRALPVAISVLAAVIPAVAQGPFQGYVATFVDYFDCDPAVSTCEPKMNYTEKMLPSGESWREARLPGGKQTFNISIVTRSRRFSVFPDVGKYYDLPNAHVAAFSNDEQCAARAVSMGPAAFVRQTRVAGLKRFNIRPGTLRCGCSRRWDARCCRA